MKKLYLPIVIILIYSSILLVTRRNQNNACPLPPPDYSTPLRVVSLAPNITEILFALGLGDNIVGVSDNCDYPQQAQTKEKIGTFWQPNTEAIIAAKPNLVITLWFEQQKQVAQTLERMGYKAIVLKLEKISELSTAIEKIGAATNRQQQAEELIKNINNRLAQLQSQQNAKEKVRVLWVVQPDPLRVAGVNTFINELIEMAGGVNAIGPTIQQYPPISTEELLSCQAQVIIQPAMDKKSIEQQRKVVEAFWKKYPNLPAVKNNRIYVVEHDTIMRLGPRLPQGLEKIIRCLYPD